MSEAIIKIKDVNKWFGDFQVLKNINLEVQQKQKIVVCGPSGSGKSTILRILAGVERRAYGTVLVKEHCWQDSSNGTWVPSWDRRVGWVPQETLLFPHLTVRENLSYGGALPDWVSETAASLISFETRLRSTTSSSSLLSCTCLMALRTNFRSCCS